MGKIKHIIVREYLTRVRKKSFLVMTLIGPLLFSALMIVPIWVMRVEDSDVKKIAVIEVDENDKPATDTLIFTDALKNKPNLMFEHLRNVSISQGKQLLVSSDYFGLLILRQKFKIVSDSVDLIFYARKQPSAGMEFYISQAIEKKIYESLLIDNNINPRVLETLKPNIKINFMKVDKEGFVKQEDQDLKRFLGYGGSLLIYFFIFLFGAQIMRGVVEEKTNRIVEVIITSVKPFQLMMGKIIGIGLVGLTQFLAWAILSLTIFQFSQSYYLREALKEQENKSTQLFQTAPQASQNTAPAEVAGESKVPDIITTIHRIDFGVIIGAFIFFFLGGFLLYGSMFAAIGSAVDSDTDVQQFMLPVTIPMIVAIIVMNNVIMNPEGQIAFWFSIIPFTSPVIMMARIPFGVPWFEVLLSGTVLILTFILMTWLSGKIYRTGILMYGKKTGYREMLKWLRYK
jgi:ABC-2 type transport system permease protein